MSAARDRKLAEIARKFQRDMEKLGLGVSMQVNGEPPVRVTTWCPACDHVAAGSVQACPTCGEAI